MPTFSLPLVGMRFRPPAEAILSVLPLDQPLSVIPEPDNGFDPNALKVELIVSTFPITLDEELSSLLPGYGFSLEEFFSQESWHIGYIAKEFAKDLAPRLKGETRVAKLGFNAEGKARVILELED